MPPDHKRCKSMSVAPTISDLRLCPEFFDIVADRTWEAWWKPHGHPLDTIRARPTECANRVRPTKALFAGNVFLRIDGGEVFGCWSDWQYWGY